MALHGSFSAGAPKSNKLSKMSSVPTTEDLKYALAEAKKHNKPVELPFENNRNLFVIKVQFHPNGPPRWTFTRGDGPNAKQIWTRDTVEVLMIQNKIRTESAYDSTGASTSDNSSSGYQAPYVPEYEEQIDEEQGYDQGGYDMDDQPADVPAASMGFGSSTPAASMGFGSPPPAATGPSYPSPPPQQGFGGIPQRGFEGSGPQDAASSQTGMPAFAPKDGATSQSGMPAWAPQPQQNPAASQTGLAAWNPQPSASQQGMPPASGGIPQQGFSEQSSSGKQAPFQPSAPDPAQSSKILMPPKLAGFNTADFNAATGQTQAAVQAQAQEAAQQQSAVVDPVYQGSDKMGDPNKVAFDMSGIFGNQPPSGGTASSASQTRMPAAKIPLPAPVVFDQNMINGVYAKLVDTRTGLMLFDSLLYFLFREFSRYEKNKTGLAVLILEVVIKQGNQISPLPPEAVPVVGQRIASVVSPVDVAAHINGSEFAILLDTADHKVLTRFSDSLYKALIASPLFPGWPENSTVVAIGAATIPHTCNQVGVVVAAAQTAKEMAKGVSPPYMLFPT